MENSSFQDESISYYNHWYYNIIVNIILNVPLAQASQDFTTLSFFIPCYLGYPYFWSLKFDLQYVMVYQYLHFKQKTVIIEWGIVTF